ncbi:MAG: hypothetical protein ACFFC0_00010 [Promethearchaeota archaeon]
MREISEIAGKATSTRPDSVVLAALLLATRGLLLITLNWILYVNYGQRPSYPNGPDVIAMAVTAPPWFFFFGLVDIWSARLLWRRRIRGWKLGVIVSVVIMIITFMTLPLIVFLLHNAEVVLFIVVGVLSMIEVIVLHIPGVRQYCRK